VYDAEIDKLVDFWTNQKGPPLFAIPMAKSGNEAESGEEVEERVLDEARDMALRNPHLSSSFLERRLRIGGRRAAQIIEQLEDEGLVTPR
jgi:S-DNA-T family DNA segregation ATPase FtsK/SpoIIIE